MPKNYMIKDLFYKRGANKIYNKTHITQTMISSPTRNFTELSPIIHNHHFTNTRILVWSLKDLCNKK